MEFSANKQGIYTKLPINKGREMRMDSRSEMCRAKGEEGKTNMRARLTSRLSLLILSFAVALFVFPAMAFAEVVSPDGTTASSITPTIQSDKADYAPGDLVTLTGSNWQPGESVHINVNDTYGASWVRNVDVTANANGNITDSFTLPNA